jgi:hypothetical protein
MTMLTADGARHSTDADLVRLLDGEAVHGGAAVSAHVKACGACRSRLEMLQRRSTLFTEALIAADAPPVHRDRVRPPFEQLTMARGGAAPRWHSIWSQRRLRAAAGLLLLAGIAAATPARAWILERVARLRGTEGPAGQRVPMVPAPAREPTLPQPTAVLFTPASAELTVRFLARQAGGTLELIAGRGSRSSAQILTNANGESILVLPSELRIRNSPGSLASYRIVLSATVRRVHVESGAEQTEATSLEVTPDGRYVIPVGRATRAAP